MFFRKLGRSLPGRDENLYVAELIEALDRIGEYTSGGQDAFNESELIQDAVTKNLMVIGEAAKNLSDETKAKAPAIRWSQVAGMRDRIAHAYFSIDLEIIWQVIEQELPNLRKAVENLPRGF
jgi:uncharacterized protein with HEPN domain